ncbi:MAG: LamG-like jellyroll fold domain-containing protein, partial [Saprospiraceae bacterium]
EYFIYAADDLTKAAVEELSKPNPSAIIVRLAGTQAPEVGRSNGSTWIGRDIMGFFKGIMSEVRIWNIGLEPADLGREVNGGESGLVSWWRFEEREGLRTNDSNGQNHASLNGNIKWVQESDPQRTGITLFLNDRGTLPTENAVASNFSKPTNQFALGVLANATPKEFFCGELEDVRIWKTARTREQIEDNLFRRLNGELNDLMAYYTFDAETQTKLSDNGLHGNHLQPQGSAAFVLSTAPIGDDAPIVRSALAGIRTPFSGFIGSTPAVQEYGDMQTDSRGNTIGVFKRCYGFVQNKALHLLTGYKVGDLAVEWIGQVQFAPQLIGFIEGAPPVPSENLTMPSVEMIGDLDDYNETSTIQFVRADETSYTYSAAKEGGIGLEVEAALKFGFKSKTDAGVALAAASLSSIEESQVMVGLRAKFESMWGWTDQANTGVSRETAKSTSLELRGRYTTPEENETEPFGRRFVPDNLGLALVQSETADVFALRLKHNNALISFSLRPNPDIPKDWNIIHFPMNPRYVKQGVLDGKIGPVADVDYPNALTYSNDVSYFKPVEAYALKNRIQKEEKELETYYNQFAAAAKGLIPIPLPVSALTLTDHDDLRAKTRRNLVNTYVWTADGGLFAESQQMMQVHSETSGSNFEFRGALGLDLQVGFAIFKVAAQFELNAMAVLRHKLEVTKSKESKTAFQLAVSVEKVERDIYQREVDRPKVVLLDKSDPKRPKPVKHPYKVDAYRFMSFFLEENSEHFDLFFNQVLDPIWIEQSDNPAAKALREARQEGKKPPCWRIMHRVTYVSRVLPPLDQSAPPSLEKALQTLDIESNYELIKQLEPYVSSKLGSFPEFADAVRDTIRQNLPELQPHTAEVIQYLNMYFGITGEGGDNGEQFGDTTLSELAPNQPPIVNAGSDQTIGLDGASVAADLEAAVIDDRLEKAEAIFVTWQKSSGPEGATFNDIHASATKAVFTKRGRYELALSANDGMLEAADALTVIVNERPVISAGVNIETTALEVLLDGQILDNGLGDPATGTMTMQWLKSGGLGAVVFEDKNALQTKATFEKPGNYLLQLQVSNGTFDTSAEVMVSVAARINRGIQALYTFEENSGQTINDVSGTGETLHAAIPDPKKVAWENGCLKLTEPTVLTTSGPASRLAAAVQATNEITVEAWIRPAAVNVPGLARILTISPGPEARNVTLAQHGGTFHFHLRTTTTNDNASNKALAGGVAEAGKLTHLVCARGADGHMRLYVNGAEVANRHVDGNCSNWAANFRLSLGNETDPSSPDRAWLGELHLVALYNRALSLAEIRQNFNFGANLNLPPTVSAGADAVVNWTEFDWSKTGVQKKSFPLDGRVTHDRPTSGGTIFWKQIGGPTNGVTIQNENAAQTTVEVTQKGRYVFRLTAQDGELLSSSETVVVVHVPPQVRIKNDTQKLALTGTSAESSLVAELLDSGRGDQPANDPTVFRWKQTSGPQAMQLMGADTLQAKAVFSARGLFLLQFEAHNGALGTIIPVQVAVNQMPVLSVPQPSVVTLPTNLVSLSGQVPDTGLGNPADALNFRWEKISGPGNATFADANKAQTTASFDVGGVYVLQLTAQNPDLLALAATGQVPVIINRAPQVSASPAPAPLLLKPGQANVTVWLDATVSDDGLPNPPGVTALKWTKKSGPSNMLIKPDNTDYVQALFTQKGKYILQVEADDGAAKSADSVTVVVNTPPVADAGPLQKTTAEGNEITIQLKGVVSDKGFGDETPQSAVAIQWKQLTGPGNAVFVNAKSLETAVVLPHQPGMYTFELSADNGFDTAKDTVTVVVNQPASVEIDVLGAEPPNPKKRTLSIRVLDTGLGDPQQDTLTFVWKKLTGAEPVVFQPDPANATIFEVAFPKAGNYTLELAVGN